MDAVAFISEHRKIMDQDKIFSMIPYLGIFYIPTTECNELWYDYEDGDLIVDDKEYIKAKMLKVDGKDFSYCHYDSHHHSVVVMSRNKKDYFLSGNIIRKK